MDLDTFRLPSKQELKRFLEVNDIAPLVVKNAEKVTLISHEDFGTVGLTFITSDNNGVINHGGGSYRNKGEKQPVDMLLSWQYGLTVLLIVINDNDIIEKAHKIVIHNTRGENLIEHTNNKKHIVIVTDYLFNLEMGSFHTGDVFIYDKNDIMILKQAL